MIQPPPCFTRSCSLVPYSPLFRSHEDTNRLLTPDDWHALKPGEQFLACFGIMDTSGMAGCPIQIERFNILRDGADKALPRRKLGDMHRFLLQTTRGI